MIGCRGQVGYVFIPLITPGKPHIAIDGKDCDVPTIPRPFGDGLPPDVNSVVAIAEENTPLLSEEAIVSHLGSFAGVSTQRDAVTGRCRAVWTSPRDVPSNIMKAGATIKILGYRTFVSEGSEIGSAGAVTRHEQLLFALVLVRTDMR